MGFRGQYFNLFINLRKGRFASWPESDGWSLNPSSPPSDAFSLGAAKIENVKKKREREGRFSFAHDIKCSDLYNIFYFDHQ